MEIEFIPMTDAGHIDLFLKDSYFPKGNKRHDNFIIPIACFAAGVCLGVVINAVYEARLSRKES
jgi:hypothetical protein